MGDLPSFGAGAAGGFLLLVTGGAGWLILQYRRIIRSGAQLADERVASLRGDMTARVEDLQADFEVMKKLQAEQSEFLARQLAEARSQLFECEARCTARDRVVEGLQATVMHLEAKVRGLEAGL